MVLATKLEAIGRWINDCNQGKTDTATTLIASAYWLNKAARVTCGQGNVGCNMGNDCTCEHK